MTPPEVLRAASPCPWCSGVRIFTHGSQERCGDCGAEGPETRGGVPPLAAWNRRAPQSAQGATGAWSPEPWEFLARSYTVYDAKGNRVAYVDTGDAASDQMLANGHRIASLSAEVERLRRNSYPHMCRADHPQIGFSENTEPEDLSCPVCAVRNEVERLRAALEDIMDTLRCRSGPAIDEAVDDPERWDNSVDFGAYNAARAALSRKDGQKT